MTRLASLPVIPISGRESSLDDQKASQLNLEVPEWRVIEKEGERVLTRSYHFPDFASALRFTEQVGSLAEAQNHHPAILTEWGKVTVTWWTHKIHGLHQNDFVMAAKTDEAYQQTLAI